MLRMFVKRNKLSLVWKLLEVKRKLTRFANGVNGRNLSKIIIALRAFKNINFHQLNINETSIFPREARINDN